MANVELGWDVDGIIEPPESVEGMLKVIGEKDEKENGTFWCWDGRVSSSEPSSRSTLTAYRVIHGSRLDSRSWILRIWIFRIDKTPFLFRIVSDSFRDW